jgi:hypothetical protein
MQVNVSAIFCLCSHLNVDLKSPTSQCLFGSQQAGKGSATLSMAYAGALFADACLRGLDGQKHVVECSYVESDVMPGIPYFSTKVRLVVLLCRLYILGEAQRAGGGKML